MHRYELPIKYLLEEWETDDNTPPYEHETYLRTKDFTEALRLAMSIEPDPKKWGIPFYDHPDCPG